MNNKEIIKNINTIYDKFFIPVYLKQHMIKTAKIAAMLCDNLIIKINKNKVVAAQLLHDLGNLLKNSEKTLGIKLDGNEDELKIIYSKFGKNEVEATLNMAKSIGANNELLTLLKNRESKKMAEILKNDSYEAKICAYSDFRVAPKGVVSREKRFEEAKKRYSWLNEKHRAESILLEKQVFEKIKNLKPEDINEQSIKNVKF